MQLFNLLKMAICSLTFHPALIASLIYPSLPHCITLHFPSSQASCQELSDFRFTLPAYKKKGKVTYCN